MSLVRTLDWLREGSCLQSAIRLESAPLGTTVGVRYEPSLDLTIGRHGAPISGSDPRKARFQIRRTLCRST